MGETAQVGVAMGMPHSGAGLPGPLAWAPHRRRQSRKGNGHAQRL